MKINWLALASETLNRFPVERWLVKPQRESESLKELQDILQQSPAWSQETSASSPEKAFLPQSEPPQSIVAKRPPATNKAVATADAVSTQETADYQDREIGKLLLRMERHCVQKFRINGKVCECGANKHLLDIESLCEETIPMVEDSSTYYQIINTCRELGPKCTVDIVATGQFDAEYPEYAYRFRDFRKELLGTLDAKALWPGRDVNITDLLHRHEQEEARRGLAVLPVVSQAEKEKIKQLAHEKIDEALGEPEEIDREQEE